MKKNYKVLLLIIFLVGYQSILYLISKLTPLKMTMLSSGIDSKIPFISYFIYFYIFWYIMLLAVPYLLYIFDKNSFCKYFTSSFICITIAFFIYSLFPTSMVRADIEGAGITNFIVKFIYFIDTPVMNCFPSMHCILSFLFIYSSLTCQNMPNWCKGSISILSLLVVASTLFVKQHVLLDVVSAFIISSVIYFVFLKIEFLNTFCMNKLTNIINK